MKSFKRYLREFAIQSTSDYVFDTPSGEAGSLKKKVQVLPQKY